MFDKRRQLYDLTTGLGRRRCCVVGHGDGTQYAVINGTRSRPCHREEEGKGRDDDVWFQHQFQRLFVWPSVCLSVRHSLLTRNIIDHYVSSSLWPNMPPRRNDAQRPPIIFRLRHDIRDFVAYNLKQQVHQLVGPDETLHHSTCNSLQTFYKSLMVILCQTDADLCRLDLFYVLYAVFDNS